MDGPVTEPVFYTFLKNTSLQCQIHHLSWELSVIGFRHSHNALWLSALMSLMQYEG